MKFFYLALIVSLYILFDTDMLQAQSSQKNLNQAELFKQFLGSWKGEVGKDTIVVGVNTPFGTGIECSSQIVSNGKILDSVKELMGYDKKYDKFIIAELIKSSPAIEVLASWFISEKSGEMVLFQDISNPDNAKLKWKFEFKSSGLIEQTAIRNNKVVKVVTLIREEK